MAVFTAPAYAGFWLRFVAYILDTIIVEAIVIPVAFVAGAIIGVIGAAGGGDRAAIQIAGGVVGFFIGLFASWLYFALLESSAKQSTWGKRALGLYVCDLGGNRISFARACGRYFGKFLSSLILLIGFIMAGFTDKKQALHDMLAGTLVMRRN